MMYERIIESLKSIKNTFNFDEKYYAYDMINQ